MDQKWDEILRSIAEHSPELAPIAHAPRYADIHMCRLCHRYHGLRFCSKFQNMSSDERFWAVYQHKYCPNCLALTHDNVRQCSSSAVCKICRKQHHTLLHRSISRNNGIPDRVPRRTNPVPDIYKRIDEAIRELKKLRDSIAPVQQGRHV